MTKTCTGCLNTKPVGEFWVSRKARDGRQYHCKECQRQERGESVKRWRQKHPERYRSLSLRSKYGLDVNAVAIMESEQLGLCLVCRRPFGPERRSVVDHRHADGQVRGLLCKTCNLGLGHFGDDPATLRAAAAYLEGAR